MRELPKILKYVDVHLEKDKPVKCCVWGFNEKSVLPFPMPEAPTLKLKYAGTPYKLYKLFCGFDIETTNVEQDGRHLAFMYHWQFSIASDDNAHVFTGRTWAGFLNLFNMITEHYELDGEKRILVWIANAGYEFSFIRKLFEWDSEDFFAREIRHPLKFRTGGFEFHEALSISGGSLAQLAKDYTTTQKLKGDLDYAVLRNSKTPLTPLELDYCINDVTILSEWSKYIFTTYILPDSRIPLTKTGILRAECRLAGEKLLGSVGMMAYRKYVQEAFPDEKTYALWFRWLFRGGYVHSNILMTGVTMVNIDSYDRTSSYPAEMEESDEFPITPFKPEPFSWDAVDSKCCIMTVTFRNLRRRWAHSLESKSKCIVLEGSADYPLIIDNGRVAQCSRMTVMITNVDLRIYERFYEWDSMTVRDFQTSERGKLPIFLRKTLSRHYMNKARLKQAGLNHTVEYVISKQKSNSFFGMLITRIELEKVVYNGEWEILEHELDFEKEIRSQFLLPQWGIFVTALARRELLDTVADITEAIGDGSGEDGAGVAYCDTDSIKVYDPKGNAKKIIGKYNERIAGRIQRAGLTPKEFYDLGMFTFEGRYKKFKTLGAKRYIDELEDGTVEATVAGLPKASILHIEGDPFEAFDLDGMVLEAEAEIKNTISYNDEPTDAFVDGEPMHEESSAGIYNIGFTLNLDKAYHALIVDGIERRLAKYGD